MILQKFNGTYVAFRYAAEPGCTLQSLAISIAKGFPLPSLAWALCIKLYVSF